MKKTLAIIFLFPFFTTLYANTYWEKINTLCGGNVSQIVEDSSGNLYTLVNSVYLYYSPNRGKNWIYQRKLPFYPLTMEIYNDTNLLIGESNGIYFSTDKGKSWNLLGLKGKTVYSIIVVGKDTIFAGTDVGIWVSFNAGNNWIPSGLSDYIISKIRISDNKTLYALLKNEKYLYYSTNLGKSWNFVEHFTSVENFFVAKDSNIFILTENLSRLYYTLDYGKTIVWEKTFASPVKDLYMYKDTNIVLTSKTLHYFTNTGELIIGISLDVFNIDSYNCLLVTKHKDIFVGSEINSIYYSKNLNHQFEIRNNGINQTTFNRIKDDIEGNIYYLNYNGKFLKSLDGGKTWDELKFDIDFNDFVIDKYKRIWLLGRGIFLSTDGGNTFKNLTLNFKEPTCNFLKIFNFDTIFASITHSTNYHPPIETFIFRSTSSGVYWTKITFPYIELYQPERFVFDSKCILYSGTIILYTSEDLGFTWRELKDFVPQITQIIVDKNDNLFVGTYSLGIYFSSDGGKTFEETNFPKFDTTLNTMCYDNNNNILFAGTNSGVYYTFANYPFKWYPLNEGLDCLDIISFAMDDSNHLYIGTNECGIYKTKFPTAYLHTNTTIKSEQNIELIPNPASNFATIQYFLKKSGYISFEILNIFGEKVLELDCGFQTEGLHFQNINLNRLSQGIYFVKIKSSTTMDYYPLTIIK